MLGTLKIMFSDPSRPYLDLNGRTIHPGLQGALQSSYSRQQPPFQQQRRPQCRTQRRSRYRTQRRSQYQIQHKSRYQPRHQVCVIRYKPPMHH